jgi:DNA-directed RNA polymerase specialized sigma24 family protein
MSKGGPTQETFERLLNWLDAERDRAGEKYEKIRLRLVRIFTCRGCCEAEDLADQTINVVAARIDWLIENYKGDPSLFFYGVAKKIYQEQFKKKLPPVLPPPPDTTQVESECACLENCLKQELAVPDRQIVLRYHEKDKQEKINLRKQIAAELGITLNALRIRVHHIHSRLRPCIEQCLQHLLQQ